MAKETTVEALLESGAHFGHLTRRWNPKMRKFIYTERNGIHIIDLRKTKVLLDIASEAAHEAASQGKVVLFVGTKIKLKKQFKMLQSVVELIMFLSVGWVVCLPIFQPFANQSSVCHL